MKESFKDRLNRDIYANKASAGKSFKNRLSRDIYGNETKKIRLSDVKTSLSDYTSKRKESGSYSTRPSVTVDCTSELYERQQMQEEYDQQLDREQCFQSHLYLYAADFSDEIQYSVDDNTNNSNNNNNRKGKSKDDTVSAYDRIVKRGIIEADVAAHHQRRIIYNNNNNNDKDNSNTNRSISHNSFSFSESNSRPYSSGSVKYQVLQESEGERVFYPGRKQTSAHNNNNSNDPNDFDYNYNYDSHSNNHTPLKFSSKSGNNNNGNGVRPPLRRGNDHTESGVLRAFVPLSDDDEKETVPTGTVSMNPLRGYPTSPLRYS